MRMPIIIVSVRRAAEARRFGGSLLSAAAQDRGSAGRNFDAAVFP